MPDKEHRKGELFILSASFLGGLFPIIVVLTYATLSGIASLAWTTLFAAILFAALMIYRGRLSELKDKRVWIYGVYVTLFIGVLYHGLYFTGLEHTTPGNVAIIVLFQTFTSFLFFNIYRKEHISKTHKLGATFMVLGALIVLVRGFGGVNIGDMLILAAQFIAPIGNYFQQEARKIASSETNMFLRSIFSAAFLFSVIYIWGTPVQFADLYPVLPFLLLTGFVFFGFEKILWLEGIHRISVTKATALTSMMPLLTLLFAWLILGQVPTIWQFASLPLLVVGVLLLTDQLKLRARTTNAVQ